MNCQFLLSEAFLFVGLVARVRVRVRVREREGIFASSLNNWSQSAAFYLVAVYNIPVTPATILLFDHFPTDGLFAANRLANE